MKMIGLVLSLLLISVLVVLQVRRMTGDDSPIKPSEPTAKFMSRCTEVAPAKVLRPKDYCRCIWQRGVRQVTHLVTDMQARQVGLACEAAQQPDGGSGDAGR